MKRVISDVFPTKRSASSNVFEVMAQGAGEKRVEVSYVGQYVVTL